MVSPSIPIVPVAAKPVVDTTVIVVALEFIVPFRVVVAATVIVPP